MNLPLELKAPVMVDFEVISDCPYNCFFCESDMPNVKFIPHALLSTKECFHILKKLADAEVFSVFFTGGEPFLRDDLPDLVKYCFDVGLEARISTNAYVLNENKIKRIVETGLDHLQVSLHGPSLIHESIVGRIGSYPVVMRNLRLLIESGMRVEIACVGLKENIAHIPTLIREIAPLGIECFRILRYVPGYRKEMLEHIPPKELVNRTLPEIIEAARECKIRLLFSFCPGLSKSPPLMLKGIHPINYTCPAGKAEFTILSNGDVYPCTFFRYKPEMCAGNILKDDVSKLWNHPKMVMLRKLTPKDYVGFCGSCERKWACYSARCVAYNIGNDIYGDDLSCYLIHDRMSLRTDRDDK